MRVMKRNSLSSLDILRAMGRGIDEITFKKITNGMSFIDRLRLKYGNAIKIGDYKLRGWKGKLSFYLFKCNKHGYVIDYPGGYNMLLVCPLCINGGKQVLDEYLEREIMVREPVIV
jgi:hypothetical protein